MSATKPRTTGSSIRRRIRQGLQLPKTRIRKIKERAATAVLDGGNGMGHVVARNAMALAMRDQLGLKKYKFPFDP
jgi:LDH2 family malate/lactate/ureidoglycolate dehydrogenase